MTNLPSRLASNGGALASVMLRGFIMIAAAVPMTAAALTVILYVALGDPAWKSFVYTLACILPLVIVGSLLLGPFGTFERANRTSHYEFQPRFETLKRRLATIPESGQKRAGWVSASAYCEAIPDQMQPQSSRWVLGVGYINLWKTLHRAEEALISVDWPNEALNQAHYDQLRIKGSKIPKASDLVKRLEAAEGALHDLAQADEDLRSDDPKRKESGRKAWDKVEPAQILVADVRRTVNEYRDNRWDGLVRARNGLNARTLSPDLSPTP